MYYFVMRNSRQNAHPFAQAAVVYANYAQFGPGERILNPRVMSRMVLWCKAGTGEVTINGNTFPFEAGHYLFLPWQHSVHYRAGKDDPFLLAGVHLIPLLTGKRPLVYEVAHTDNHPLAHVSYRRDIAVSELDMIQPGRLDDHPPLAHLLEYIVTVFVRANPPEWLARQMARQLLGEMLHARLQSGQARNSQSLEMDRIRQYVSTRLHRPLSLRDLVEFTRLSPSTVGRLFRDNLGTTPVAWLLRLKMERAQFLFRTRRLSVAQVGAQVGFPDPYYFSKCFKKATGFAPREFLKRNRRRL